MKKRNLFELMSKLMLFVLAVVSGGAAMAVEVMSPGTDGKDPNAGTPIENAIEANPSGVEVPGGVASGSALEELDQAINEVDDYVAKFKSHKYPMHHDFLKLARQVKVDTKEPVDFEIGEGILDFVTKGETEGNLEGDAAPVELNLYSSDKKLFVAGSTVLVDEVSGYEDKEGGAEDGSPLVLYITSVSEDQTKVMAEAINGKIINGQTHTPPIPAGSTLHIMAPAMSESEVEIAPDAAYPDERKCYLQKKVCAITYTELFERIKKKSKWNVQELKDWQLDQFRRKCTRSMLIGAGKKFRKRHSKYGVEDTYTQKGVLRQIRLGYQTNKDGKYTFADLIGISKMAFGPFATTNVVDAYCGSNAIENLLNVDLTGHRDIVINTDKNIEANLTTLKTTFGTIRFKHEYALDDLGLSDYMVIFAMSDAKRFYYDDGTTINIDHSKGEGGEVRQAKSSYYIQDDCLALRSYNSLLVGPDVTSVGYSNLEKTVQKVQTLPASGAADTIYYLTADTDDNQAGLYEWTDGEWVGYRGEINA